MTSGSRPRDHRGRAIDFGRTAADYDRHLAAYLDAEVSTELVVPHRVFVATGVRPG